MKSTHSLLFVTVLVCCLAALGCGKAEKPVPGEAPPVATVTPAASSVTESASIDGMLVNVTHPKLDSGQIQAIFDGVRETLARTENATTAVIDIAFPASKKSSGIQVITGTMDIGLKVTLTGKGEPLTYSKTMVQQTGEPTCLIEFGGVREFDHAKVEVTNLLGGDGHIHIYEVKFK